MADSVKVTWTTDRPIHEDASYSVALTNDHGFMRRELSVSFFGEEFAELGDELSELLGSPWSVSVHDLDTSDWTFVETEPVVEGSSLTMYFPRTSMERQGAPFGGWYAFIDVGREPKTDHCPDPPPGEQWPPSRQMPVVPE